MKLLKDETDQPVSSQGPLIGREAGNIPAIQKVRSAIGPIEKTQDMHQG
jgi:hypothetical protein